MKEIEVSEMGRLLRRKLDLNKSTQEVDSTIRRTVRFEPPQTLIFILKSQNGWRYPPLYHSCLP